MGFSVTFHPICNRPAGVRWNPNRGHGDRRPPMYRAGPKAISRSGSMQFHHVVRAKLDLVSMISFAKCPGKCYFPDFEHDYGRFRAMCARYIIELTD
ncbi:MAG: hypothetical protein QF473_31295 [Planctomycetota bacterium]|nr:hypothetical protein [Planctomycetota bacterium]